MALLDAYATAAEYRARTDKTGTGDDDDILEQLKSTARLLERSLGVAPGSFNSTGTSVVRYFTPVFSAECLFIDEDERQNFLISVDTDGLAIDTGQNGAYDTTIDPSGEAWIVLIPRNASGLSLPYTGARVLGHVSGASFARFPEVPYALKVTGVWGHSAVPDIIRELNVKLTRDIRDSLEAGPAGSIGVLGQAQFLRSDTWRLWKEVQSRWAHRIPGLP